LRVKVRTSRCVAVTERPAQRVDPRRYRRIRDDPAIPYGGQQIVLADHTIAALYQENEQIEGFWFELDRFLPAA
jgi:hypothetical protein